MHSLEINGVYCNFSKHKLRTCERKIEIDTGAFTGLNIE
jgi:hypothetical protein